MATMAGWVLAALAVAVGTWQWGWRGALLGATLVVFWLLLQFSRSLRVLRQAGQAPMGQVANAVMLHSRLRPGMTLMQILPLSGSLGERTAAPPDETFVWRDGAGDRVVVVLRGGRLAESRLERQQG